MGRWGHDQSTVSVLDRGDVRNLGTTLDVTWWRHQMESFFRVTGPLWGESTCHRRIPVTEASEEEL